MKKYTKPTLKVVRLVVKENLANTPAGKYDPTKNAWVWTYEVLQSGS